MAQATLIAKVDSKVKQKAQQLAESFGLTLSSLVNIQLRNFIANKKLIIGKQEDDNQLSYYENNPNYIEVNEDVKTVLDFLKKNIKKNEKMGKISK